MLNGEVATLKAEAANMKELHRDEVGKLQGRLDLEMSIAAMTREEAEKAKGDLDRTAHNLRFEQDVRSERERDVRDRDHRVAESQVSNALLQQRVGEANALFERERVKVAEVEAALRLKEREAERALAAEVKGASQKEEMLRVQLRAAKDLANARHERSALDSAVAKAAQEALTDCRAQKAHVEETLALALKAAAKEKRDLDDRLAAASQARRLTEASEHATTSRLAAAEEREQDLREAVAQRESISAELEHRLQVASALADDQSYARAVADRDADDMRQRLDNLVEASNLGLSRPLTEPILTLSGQAASEAVGVLGGRSPTKNISTGVMGLTPSSTKKYSSNSVDADTSSGSPVAEAETAAAAAVTELAPSTLKLIIGMLTAAFVFSVITNQ